MESGSATEPNPACELPKNRPRRELRASRRSHVVGFGSENSEKVHLGLRGGLWHRYVLATTAAAPPTSAKSLAGTGTFASSVGPIAQGQQQAQ